MIRRWYRSRRRRRCLRRGHPMARWSPVVQAFKEPDRMVDGEIVEGRMWVERAWRCEIHDVAETTWEEVVP